MVVQTAIRDQVAGRARPEARPCVGGALRRSRAARGRPVSPPAFHERAVPAASQGGQRADKVQPSGSQQQFLWLVFAFFRQPLLWKWNNGTTRVLLGWSRVFQVELRFGLFHFEKWFFININGARSVVPL